MAFLQLEAAPSRARAESQVCHCVTSFLLGMASQDSLRLLVPALQAANAVRNVHPRSAVFWEGSKHECSLLKFGISRRGENLVGVTSRACSCPVSAESRSRAPGQLLFGGCGSVEVSAFPGPAFEHSAAAAFLQAAEIPARHHQV